MTKPLQNKPYQRYLFVVLSFVTISAVLVIGIAVYANFSHQVLKEAKEELMGIATKTAALIPVEEHEKLQKFSDQNTETYRILELYLQSVMAGNDKIDDIYTFRPTNTPHLMTFVVSGKQTKDINGDDFIDETEEKAMLGEEYETSAAPQLEEGLIKPSVDNEITTDKWGSWISGYAPLKDKNGTVVGIVGVDYAAKTISQERLELFKIFILFESIAIILLLLISYFLSKKISAPYRMLFHALEEIRIGNNDYTLNLNKLGKIEKIFAEIFNSIKENFTEQKKKDAEKKEPNQT